MQAWFHWRDGDLVLHLSVQPRCGKDELAGAHNGRLRVRLTAPPVDGKANAHLTAFFARLCGVRKTDVILEAGESSRQKRIRVRNPHTFPAGLADCRK